MLMSDDHKTWLFEVVRDGEEYQWIETGTSEQIEDGLWEIFGGGANHVDVWVEDLENGASYFGGKWRRWTSVDAGGL
jgi:hypothetical protein